MLVIRGTEIPCSQSNSLGSEGCKLLCPALAQLKSLCSVNLRRAPKHRVRVGREGCHALCPALSLRTRLPNTSALHQSQASSKPSVRVSLPRRSR